LAAEKGKAKEGREKGTTAKERKLRRGRPRARKGDATTASKHKKSRRTAIPKGVDDRNLRKTSVEPETAHMGNNHFDGGSGGE